MTENMDLSPVSIGENQNVLMSAPDKEYMLRDVDQEQYSKADLDQTINKDSGQPPTTLNQNNGKLVENSIFIKDGEYHHKVMICDILFICCEHVYVTVHTLERKYTVRGTMQQFLDKLNSPRFFRLHRSYAVNVEKIDKINNVYVVINGQQIPIAKNYRDELLSLLIVG